MTEVLYLPSVLKFFINAMMGYELRGRKHLSTQEDQGQCYQGQTELKGPLWRFQSCKRMFLIFHHFNQVNQIT